MCENASPTEPVFIPAVTPPAPRSGRALWFLFRGTDLLVHDRPAGDLLPEIDAPAALGVSVIRSQYLGTLDELPCFSGELPAETEPPAGMLFTGLRPLHGRVCDALFWLAARAIQVVDWDRNHQFCGRCGAATTPRSDERARECTACGLLFFPRLSPAVIVSVVRGDEVLLARSHRLPPALYSVIAGFVEPGETLEQAVEREVAEEVGVRVRDLRYFASQPWPFPNSLMLAFTAEYAGGDIRIDRREIEDARWFRYDRLPPIPGSLSVSRRLIDHFVTQARRRSDTPS